MLQQTPKESRYPWKARLLVTTWLCSGFLTGVALAGPVGGVVSHGQADIGYQGPLTTVNQTTDRAVIDWQSFNVSNNEEVRFNQLNASSVAVNRIHDVNPSTISGKLTANGQVVSINANGIVFGHGAKIDVNGLVASTASATDKNLADFVSGARQSLILDVPGQAKAVIMNAGTITIHDAGLAAFVGPNVINNGIIIANKGRVTLAGADTATVDLYGDGLLDLAVSDHTEKLLVEQGGLIQADGGKVILTAGAGEKIVDSVINMNGIIQARSVDQKNGKIILGDGHSKVNVKGVLDTSGRATGQKGGTIEITGKDIALKNGTRIDASGDQGGGSIKIGGDYKGQGDLKTADTVTMEKDAVIYNDAICAGDAGRTILWSDQYTKFDGKIYARGGEQGGKGGFVETSGKKDLSVSGFVDLTAADGTAGTWLLDPTNITIYNRSVGGTDNINTVTTDYLENASNTANIDLIADNNLTLDLAGDTLTAASNRDISLTATSGNILTASNGTLTATGSGSINLTAGNGIILNHAIGLNTDTGNINVNSDVTSTVAQSWSAGSGKLTTHAVNMGANNLTLTADNMDFLGDLSGTGTLTLQASSITRPVYINHAVDNGTNLHLSSGDLGHLKTGWSLINIGRSDSKSDMIFGGGGWIWTNSMNFRTGGAREIYGEQRATGSTSLTFYSGTSNLFSNIIADTGNITFSSAPNTYNDYGHKMGSLYLQNGQIVTNGGNITFDRLVPATGSSTINSHGGNITVTERIERSYAAGGTNTLIFDAGNGAVSFGDTVNGIFGGGSLDFSVTAKSISFNGAWGLTTPIGKLTLISKDGLSLPTITSGSIFAQTTNATSDITLGSGNILTTDATGTALTLVAARNFINSGNLVAGNGGRWLVYSTNPSGSVGTGTLGADFEIYNCTYNGTCSTSIPTTGHGLIYRQAQVVTPPVTPPAIPADVAAAVNPSAVKSVSHSYIMETDYDSAAPDSETDNSTNEEKDNKDFCVPTFYLTKQYSC